MTATTFDRKGFAKLHRFGLLAKTVKTGRSVLVSLGCCSEEPEIRRSDRVVVVCPTSRLPTEKPFKPPTLENSDVTAGINRDTLIIRANLSTDRFEPVHIPREGH